MKKLFRKIGLSVLGATILCLILSVLMLIFNGIGHIASNDFGNIFKILKITNETFLNYVACGMMAIFILFTIAIIFIAGYFLMLPFATRYNEKKKGTKREPFECPYDVKARSCQHYNGATGYMDIDCSDCDWYNKGIRPSKI